MYMRVTFNNFIQPLNYLRTVSIINMICLITKYLHVPYLNYRVTSMKDCEQTHSTEEMVDVQLFKK